MKRAERCPICGSRNVQMYVYGEDTRERRAMVRTHQNRMIYGGQGIGSRSPKCKCASCGRNFGITSHTRGTYAPLQHLLGQLEAIEYSKSGMCSWSRLCLYPGGYYLSVFPMVGDGGSYSHSASAHVSPELFYRTARHLLDQLYVMDWARRYFPLEYRITDSMNWDLTLRFRGKTKPFHVSGYHIYPPNFPRIQRAFYPYFLRENLQEHITPFASSEFAVTPDPIKTQWNQMMRFYNRRMSKDAR